MSKLNRNWLIAGLLIAGALMLVLGGGDEPEPGPVAERSPADARSLPRGPAAGHQVPVQQAPVFSSPAPRAGAWQFRPLDEDDRSRAQQQAYSPGTATPPAWQPAPPVRDGMAGAPAGGYRFRPLERPEGKERYTGSFPEPFHPGTLPPLMTPGPQGPGGYAGPWGRGELHRMSADNRIYR
jgi:hypothetical protein